MDANKLIEECENNVSWKNFLDSFKGNFKRYRDIIEKKLNEEEIDGSEEIKKFIEICDSRIRLAKTYLQQDTTLLGFFSGSLSIVLTVSVLVKGEEHADAFMDLIIGKYGFVFPIVVSLLIAIIVFLFGLLLYCRTHIHAWTAFKEGVILNKEVKISDEFDSLYHQPQT